MRSGRQNYPYLLEVRIGHARDRVAGPMEEVKSVFHLRSESPTVPHMTLYGPFRLKQGYTIGDLRDAIESSVQGYDELAYTINGWDYKTGQNGGVIAYKVEVSREMQKCHRVLWDSLQRLTVPKHPWDNNPKDMWFHITLAYHLKDRKFRGIKRYLNIDQELSENFFSRILDQVLYGGIFKKTGKISANPVILPHRGLRITILHHRVIAAEYDLVLKQWLNRSEAKSERVWGQTLQGYRRKNGLQKTKPEYRNEQTIFVIGDLHLGHTNIITYCCRPFFSSNIQEMDNILINNWNFTVKPHDTVLFLGDLTHGGGVPPYFYLSKLHGRKIFINGNHDEGINFGTNSLLYRYSGIEFFLIHDPHDTSDIPEDFHGWVIHGHVHNNDLKNYPFFDPGNKRVNVSAETIHYQPIPLQEICDLIESEKRGLLLYPGSGIPVLDAGRNKSDF